MRTEPVEIWSDGAPEGAKPPVMRHPAHALPGVLVSGDSLTALCASADQLVAGSWGVLSEEDFDQLSGLRDQLRRYLHVYKAAMAASGA